MSTTIICVGKPMSPAAGKYDSAAFDRAVEDLFASPCPAYEGKKFKTEGKIVLIGEGMPAWDTAEKLLLPCQWSVDSLLNEIPVRSFADSDSLFTERQWIKKAAAQRRRGDSRQPESSAAVKARADRLIEKLAAGDYILVTYPAFLSVLLKRLHAHNYVVKRTGFMGIRPYEWLMVSPKEAHCGGCGHNCFLANPGCGVGRDKAMRRDMRIVR